MDRSLDDLIRFLLEQIALCGELGALPTDVLDFLDQYYAKRSRNRGYRLDRSDESGTTGTETTKIDRLFQEQVWRWLTRHPETRVGGHGEGNRMSLTEVEAHNEKTRHFSPPNDGQNDGGMIEVHNGNVQHSNPQNNDNIVDSKVTAADGSSAIANTAETEPVTHGPSSHATASLDDHRIHVESSSPKTSILHLFTTKERMWHAAAGHGPDLDRIPALEFECLSIIAAHREKGVLQPDLVRLSGQDKRSVPPRTQSLHDKGYIVKKSVVSGGARTSLCMLKRFVVPGPSDFVKRHKTPQNQTELVGKKNTPHGVRESVYGVVEPQMRQMFDILRELKIITWDDLKKNLGIWRQLHFSSVLADAVRRLEGLGYVQRVRAAGNLPGLQRRLFKCVKLVREPQENEWQVFFTMQREGGIGQRQASHDQTGKGNGEEIEDDYRIDTSTQVSVGSGDNVERDFGEPVPTPLLWTPDRLFVNILHDVIQSSGPKGMTSINLKDQVVGEFFTRPLDQQMSRIVEVWQVSQPMHLRHLAIIRDTTISGKMSHYLYYTHDVFKGLVEAGVASWEAVETIQADKTTNAHLNVATSASPDLDEWGFPKLDGCKFQGPNNDASLAECITAAEIKSIGLPKRNALLSEVRVVPSKALKRPRKGTALGLVGLQTPIDDLGGPSRVQQSTKIKGRPRKHWKPDIAEDVGMLSPEKAMTIRQSQMRAKEYQKRKAEKEVTQLIEAGNTDKDARVYVIRKNAANVQATGPSLKQMKALEALRVYESSLNLPSATDYSSITVASTNILSLWEDMFSTDPTFPIKSQTVHDSINSIGYSPSILAHSFLIPTGRRGRPKSSPGTKGGSGPKKAHDIGYLPSVAAHSFLVSHPVITAPKERKTRQKITKVQPEAAQVATTTDQSSMPFAVVIKGRSSETTQASIAVANKRKIDADSLLMTPCQPTPKRRGQVSMRDGLQPVQFQAINTNELQQYLVPSATYSDLSTEPIHQPGEGERSSNYTKVTRKRKKSSKIVDGEDAQPVHKQIAAKEIPTGQRPHLTYNEQTDAIRRTEPGVHIGLLVGHKTESHRGRPRKSRMAIFKTLKLTNIAWFMAGSSASLKDNVSLGALAHMPVAENYVERGLDELQKSTKGAQPYTPGRLPAMSPPAATTLLQDTLQSLQTPYVSPYAKVHSQSGGLKVDASTGQKRKRATTISSKRQPPPKGAFSTTSSPKASHVSQQLTLSKPPSQGFPFAADKLLKVKSIKKRAGTIPGQSSESHENGISLDFSDSDSASTATITSAVAQIVPQITQPSEFGDSDQHSKPEQCLTTVNTGATSMASINILETQPGIESDSNMAGTISHSESDIHIEQHQTPPVRPQNVVALATPTEKLPLESNSCAGAAQQDASTILPQTTGIHGEREPADSTLRVLVAQKRGTILTKVSQINNDEVAQALDVESPHIESPNELAQGTTINSGLPKVKKITPTGGSVAVMRRNIIMEIVEKCGGVFPGDKEIEHPYCTLWIARTGGGRPDYRTIQVALKALFDANKLRKLMFTFSDKHGMATTKSIVALSSIPPKDPRIAELQRRIIEVEPEMYIPDHLEAIAPPKKPKPKPRPKQPKPILGLTINRPRPWKLRVVEESVQLQHPPRTTLHGARRAKMPSATQTRRHQREEELRRRFADELGELDLFVNGYDPDGVRRHRFGADGIDNGRLAHLKALYPLDYNRGGTTTRTVQPKGRLMRLVTTSGPSSVAVLENAYRQRESSSIANQLECEPISANAGDQPQVRFAEVLGLDSKFDRNPSPEPEDISSEDGHSAFMDRTLHRLRPPGNGEVIERPLSQRIGSRKSRIGPRKSLKRQLQEIGAEHVLLTPAAKRYRKSAAIQKTQNVESLTKAPADTDAAYWQMLSILDPVRTFHIPSGTFSTGFTSQYVPSVPAARRYRRSINKRRKLDAEAWDPVSSLMNPEKIFHAPSGTFSAGFRAHRKERTPLPHSLEDLLSQPYDTNLVRHIESIDRAGDTLLTQIDGIQKWELGNPGHANVQFDSWQFINLHLHHPHEVWQGVPRDAHFADDLKSGRRGDPGFLASTIAPAKKKDSVSRLMTRPLMSWQGRSLSTFSNTRSRLRNKIDGRPFERLRARGPRLARLLGPDGDRRIMIAVLIVRTLTGGMEQNIDWVLLTHIFDFQYPERLIHQRWALMLQKHRLVVDKLQFDFQELFMRGYESGMVPPLNYDKLEDYDWNWLVDWTFENIETPISGTLPELPPTPEQRDERFGLREIHEKENGEFFELEAPVAAPKRRAILHRHPNVVPLLSSGPPKSTQDENAIARSLVKSNIVTPNETYSAELARQRLGLVGEAAIADAVRDLLLSKVIAQENKGRLVPGRNYDVSEHFLMRLRKNLDGGHFRRAVSFKTILDYRFQENKTVDFDWNSADADAMVVLNLVAHRRINLIPRDPPMKEFGLLDFGYKTHKMDKSRLRFAVEIQPTASYVQGNPLSPLLPPPGPACPLESGDAGSPASSNVSKHPIWIDINCHLVPVIWELTLAAVLSIMAVKPGVSASDMEKYMRPSLELWEIELMMEWCVKTGVGRWARDDDTNKEKGSVVLSEWWWLALGGTAGDIEMNDVT